MAIATGTAIALGTAAASAYGAHKASSAAKQAAQIQDASANKALGLQERIYNEQKQQQQPYVTGGQSAFQDLLNGWQSKQRGQAPQYAPMAQPQGSQPNPFGQALGGPQMPQGRPQMPQGGPMAQAMGRGGMVTMRAPTGETSQVPSHMVSQAEQKGAVRI